MSNMISERSLEERVSRLPKEMSPKRDLWQGIERAISTTSQVTEQTKSKVPMTWAASIVAAVLLTWFSFSPQQPNGSETLSLAKQMEQHFETQKQLILTSFGQPDISALPTEMQMQLNELSSARLAIDKALKDDPKNSDLLNLLRFTQKQELALIKQLFSPQWQTI